MLVAIWTTAGDTTADRVSKEVTRMGGDVVRLDTDGYGEHYKFGWHPQLGGRVFADGRWCTMAELGAIYNRRPALTEVPLTERDFGVHESWYFSRSLLLESTARWLNHPAAVDGAENKLRQLRIAAQCGFSVPPSLLTSDPHEAAAFCTGRSVVCKPGFAGLVENRGEKRVVYAWKVPKPLPPQGFASVSLSPTFLQEEVPKCADVRATAVGDSLSCVRIRSPSNVLDWRQEVTGDRLKYDLIVAPQEVRDATRKLMEALDLSFGAFDFAIDHHGQWWFLEVNPSGQWEWLDVVAGTHIAEEIAKWLTAHEAR